MRFLLYVLLFVQAGWLFSSCKPDDEKLNMSPSVRLRFVPEVRPGEKTIENTITFDTVFVSTGSITKRLWVYNDDKQAVNIERIELARASGMQYDLVINGQTTNSATNVKLRGNDSLLVLVKVKINPHADNQPLLVTDSIRFTTNGNLQDVDLVAYGRNAYFHTFSYTNLEYLNECPVVTWLADKPHVIYGVVGVPQGCELIVNPGAELYFHAGSAIVVEGTLTVLGKKDQRVTMQGDRLEERYDNRPGQWYGIVMSNTITESYIGYTDIKNAVVGIEVNAQAETDTDLVMEQTTIRNMIRNALVAIKSEVRATNCVFTNTGELAVGTLAGGVYEFVHCTIANFGGFFLHDQPSALFEARTKADGVLQDFPLSLKLYNSIIYGSLRDEVVITAATNPASVFDFKNNIIRTEKHADLFSGNNNVVTQVVNYPGFNSPTQGDLIPDSANSTVAIGLPGLTNVDIRGNTRPFGSAPLPDVGAYEVDQP